MIDSHCHLDHEPLHGNIDAINLESIAKHDYLISGKPINKIDILFKKIEKKND